MEFDIMNTGIKNKYQVLHLLVLSIVLFNLSFPCYAQEIVRGKILSDTEENLPYASVVMLSSQDSTLLTHSVSDSLGLFSLQLNKVPQKFILRVTYIGYYPYEAEYSEKEVGNIKLRTNSQLLGEVVVSPSEVNRLSSHESYRFNPMKMKNYSTFLEALSLIPSLTVTGWRTLTASDGGSVLILLNGVKVEEKDLLVIDKGDISKVDVYRNPPARFISMGASMVINVITKKEIQGGNIFVDLTDAVTRLDGTNIFSAAYNVNKWRFSTTYDNVLSRSIYRQDEKLVYNYENKKYSKEKIGMESPWERKQHNFQFGVMKMWGNNLQLNATGKLSLYDELSNYQQKVISSEVDILKANSPSHIRWQSYAWDVYIAKRFGKKRELLFDFSGGLYKSQLNSSYIEEKLTGEKFFDEYSKVYGLKKSTTADLQYSHFFEKATLKFGIRDNFSTNDQELHIGEVAMPRKSFSSINILNIYSDASISIGKWQLYGSLGLQQVNFRNPKHNQSFSFFTFKPNARVYYTPSKGIGLFAFYHIDNITPSISMLTETPIYKDYKYVFVGNADLKPYLKHRFTAGGNFYNNYLTTAINLSYSFAQGAILPFFEKRESYIAETYKNLNSLADFLVAWQIKYMPLGNPKLSFSSWGNYVLGHIQNEGNKWDNNYLRYFFQIDYNIKNWHTMLMYQSASNYMQGLWLIKAPKATVAEVSYKTNFGLNIGIGGKYLFVKEYRSGQKTHPGAILQMDRWNISNQTANTIYLKLSYNFSFGKKIDMARQKINNTHSDTGLLTK